MPNITLRYFKEKDTSFFLEMYNNAINMEYIPFKKRYTSKKEITERFNSKKGYKLFVVERISDKQYWEKPGSLTTRTV